MQAGFQAREGVVDVDVGKRPHRWLKECGMGNLQQHSNRILLLD